MFMPPLVRPIWRARPLFDPQARRRAVCLEVGCVDHDGLVFGVLGGQAHHDPGEDPVIAPALPPVVEGLRRAVFFRRITPAQAIAIDEDYTAQDAAVIDAGLAMARRKERLEALHLGLGKPVKIAHRSVSLQSLNHAKNLKSMGLEPRRRYGGAASLPIG
jgi:hypothetical protein